MVAQLPNIPYECRCLWCVLRLASPYCLPALGMGGAIANRDKGGAWQRGDSDSKERAWEGAIAGKGRRQDMGVTGAFTHDSDVIVDGRSDTWV